MVILLYHPTSVFLTMPQYPSQQVGTETREIHVIHEYIRENTSHILKFPSTVRDVPLSIISTTYRYFSVGFSFPHTLSQV